MPLDENQQGAVDVLLVPFLAAETDGQAAACLERLFLDGLEQIIADKINAKFRSEKSPDECADCRSEVKKRLLEKFVALKNQKSEVRRLENLHNFTAGVVRHVWLDYLRRKKPEWVRLKNRICYLLDSDAEFVRLAKSSGALRTGAKTPTRLSENEIVERVRGAGFNPAQKLLPELLTKILAAASGAVAVNCLVQIVSELWNADKRPLEIAVSNKILDEINAHRNGAAETLQTTLEILWREIVRLPSNQRRALLLNLRDAENYEVVGLFVQTNTASLREIADVLGFDEEKFAEIYNQLPLSDKRIAVLLDLETWQISNLRSVARKRLRRNL